MLRPLPSLKAFMRLPRCIRMVHLQNELARLHRSFPNDLTGSWEQFESAFTQNDPTSLSLRPQIYQLIRDRNFENVDRDLLDLIAPGKRHLFDLKFICEYLLSKDRDSLRFFLLGLVENAPIHAETLLNYAVRELTQSDGTTLAVQLFAEILVKLGIDPSSLNKFSDQRHVNSLQTLANADGFLAALEELSKTNSVLASRLVSAVIQHFTSIKNPKVVNNVWKMKQDQGLLMPTDLHWMMLFYVYIGQPHNAINAYDNEPDLRDGTQNDALLLAAAEASDWDRLQSTFEEIDLAKKTTETNYEITLRALGTLGGSKLLDQLMENMIAAGPVLPLKVYHALLYSYGKLGHMERVKSIFKELCDQTSPTRLTFSILLSAIKQSGELEYAQQVVAKMIGDYQIPMSNDELTQLLGLCADRKDLVSARSIFKWCSKLFEPDQISWNAYLTAISADGDAPYQEWKKMPHKSDIVTLTAVLVPYARYGYGPRCDEIISTKQKLGLKSDSKWLGTVLLYYCQTNNTVLAEDTFAQLLKMDKKLPGGYYATLMDMYIRLKQRDKSQDLFKLLRESQVAPGMDFYAKYLRALISYDPRGGSELANKVVMNMFREPSVYQITSRKIPRTAIPSNVIKPVVRSLIKNGGFKQASELIAETEQQNPPIRDSWTIPELRMELLHGMKNHTLVSFHWLQFLERLRQAFVSVGTTSGTTDYRIPPSEGKRFWRLINIELERLMLSKSYQEALSLPAMLESTYGLQMSSKNWNFLVKQLATCESESMLIEAYDIAEKRLALNWLKSGNKEVKIHPLLDNRSIRILHSCNTRLVQAIARRKSWSVDETWNKHMLRLYPLVLKVFNIMKIKIATTPKY